MRASVQPRGLERDSLVFAALAIVALIAAIVGGLWLTRTPRSGGLRLTTDPLDSVVTLDGVTVGGSASPFVLTTVTPDVTHEIEVSKPGYRSWRTRLVLQPGQEVALPHVQLSPDAPQSAPRLAQPRPVEVVPKQANELAAAEVKAPPVSSPPPAAKPTSTPLRPTRAPRQPVRKSEASPDVGGGGTATLRINSRPWSRVYVDGRLVGNTPRTDLVVSAGRHTVTLVNPDFNLKKILVVQLKRGELVTKIVTLGE
jgi:hypothetical protein